MKSFATFLAGVGLAAMALAQTGNASGEVTKVDKAGSRLEIRHGEIKALDMPPMRMLYRVRDAKLLEGLVVGDKVRFTAEKAGGQFTVTAVSKSP